MVRFIRFTYLARDSRGILFEDPDIVFTFKVTGVMKLPPQLVAEAGEKPILREMSLESAERAFRANLEFNLGLSANDIVDIYLEPLTETEYLLAKRSNANHLPYT